MVWTEAAKAPLVRADIERPDPSLVQEAAEFGTATIHEAQGQRGALPSGIKPVSPSFRCCGPALTVLSPAGDNLWLHRAIYMAQPGDVIIADLGGQYEAGYWGEIMTHAAMQRGIAGVVLDGCARDGSLLEELGLPIFSRGLCIRGTTKNRQAVGGINQPIRIGDVVVFPGDLVAGDRDGVVIMPRQEVADVIGMSRAREQKEAKIIEDLKAGATTLDLYGFH